VINSDLRAEIARIVHESGEGHIPSSFSIVDIIEAIYSKHIDLSLVGSSNKNRDFFILSKGHGALALYVVLKKYGFVSERELATYSASGGTFAGHPDRTKHPAIEASTGSLGHGFPIAVGVALGKKISGSKGNVIALLGDGETHEGTVWEAAHFAANRGLNNLVSVIDRNESALQLLPVDDLEAKFRAFGWDTFSVNGHDLEEFHEVLMKSKTSSRPTAVIAQTVKGKGVQFLEGHGSWHHRIPTDSELLEILNLLGEK